MQHEAKKQTKNKPDRNVLKEARMYHKSQIMRLTRYEYTKRLYVV